MGASVLLRCIGFWFLLLTSGIASSQTIGALQVAPKSTPAGSGATVFAVAQITAPEVIASSINLQKIDAQGRATIIGTLRDDGTEGDATANDRLFTLRFSVFEQSPITFTYRVSAAVQGKVTRIFSAPATFAVTGTVGTGISITQPANLVFTNISPVTVSGTTGDPGASVRVNGILATKSGTTFQASVPLQEGNNTLTAVAANTNNTQSTASVQVTLDTTPPKVTVDSPPSGFTTTDASITVTGMVNDIVVGTVNDKQAQVTVGGVAAQVSNRTFTATPVPLQLGLNTIPVIARDQTGNSATLNLRITREAATGSVIKSISGNNQSGTIGSALAAPLVVQLLDGSAPLANTHVFFKITENDGFLQPGTGKPRLVTVITNAQGQAQATLTLGNRAGGGNNTVEAYASNVKGTAIFTASGKSKGASRINVDSGTNQFGAVNQALPLPFVVVVTDEGFNRLAGVPVTFTVRQGNGSINGAASVQTVTDSDGRALATLKLGTQPGQDNNLVEATFAGNAGFPAAFTASGKVPGNPALTTISGVVQDNSNNPISNVTMRLFKTNQGTANNQPVEVGTPVNTDAKGLFKITSAPVGFFKLMADGTTATQAGKQFPTLEYDIITVAGQDNGVGSPIFLPELDADAKLCVDATTGGVLTLSKSPGFSLSIAPGSATFPGGSKTGCVTVTPVNPDKVPMVPGFGQQPRFVVTIQPVGTTFNPPAAISMPNMDGLAPNAKTEMYSFDHDLASFVAIGTGTVSQDGSNIASDPGVGVIKAGWHCGGNPNPTGSAGTCQECQQCAGTICIDIPGNTTSVEASSQVSANSPQVFPGGQSIPFDPNVSGSPGQHLVVFYKDVVDKSKFSINDFTVKLNADIDCVRKEERPWRLASGPKTGSLVQISSRQAEFTNPKKGGYFKFRYEPSKGSPSEANLALPLAGADITSRVISDLGLVNAFATRVIKKYNIFQRNFPSNGKRWFYNGGAGDYLGRPNNSATQTMRLYNQVNSDGFGAVVTWYETPIRLAKVSNFLVGYASEKIGVIDLFLWISQVLGTGNDESASTSFQLGVNIANGTKQISDIKSTVQSIFDKSDDKNQKLWPNPESADNFLNFVDFPLTLVDTNFSHPGFLEMQDP